MLNNHSKIESKHFITGKRRTKLCQMCFVYLRVTSSQWQPMTERFYHRKKKENDFQLYSRNTLKIHDILI